MTSPLASTRVERHAMSSPYVSFRLYWATQISPRHCDQPSQFLFASVRPAASSQLASASPQHRLTCSSPFGFRSDQSCRFLPFPFDLSPLPHSPPGRLLTSGPSGSLRFASTTQDSTRSRLSAATTHSHIESCLGDSDYPTHVISWQLYSTVLITGE
jgi:hypothetical protein